MILPNKLGILCKKQSCEKRIDYLLVNDLYFLYLHNIFAYITHIVSENTDQ